MNSIRRFTFALFVTGFVVSAKAQPQIQSVNSTSETEFSIFGSAFGLGSTVEMYDDFEQNTNAVDMQSLDLSNAIQGTWEPLALESTPKYTTDARSGSFSALTWDNNTNKLLQLDHQFNSPIQSLFFSYWVKIPNGYPFPGMDNSHGGFSTDSSWKFAWIYDASYSGADADLCLPTHVGYGSAQLGGNDMVLTWLPKLDTWWSWGHWIRIDIHLNTNSIDPTLPGQYTFQTWSKEHGLQAVQGSKAVFDSDGPTVKQFQRVHIPGWIREFNNGEGRPLYDDIYIASGPNALARVEITNNADYSLSDEFAIQNVTSWTDTEVKFHFVEGDLSSDSTKFIHVFHSDGSYSSAQFPFLNANPKPPLNLQAN